MYDTSTERRIALIEAAGFQRRRSRAYAASFQTPDGDIFYLCTTKSVQVVVHPERAQTRAMSPMGGRELFNSNFATFPRKTKGGLKPERFGIAFDLESESELIPFLRGLAGVR